MEIYKILRDAEWRQLAADGVSPGAPVDVADGFVHFSTAGQAGETLARHFAGETGLWLIACDYEPTTHCHLFRCPVNRLNFTSEIGRPGDGLGLLRRKALRLGLELKGVALNASHSNVVGP